MKIIDLDKFGKLADSALIDFVNQIGLDGETFVNINDPLIIWSNTEYQGEYLSPTKLEELGIIDTFGFESIKDTGVIYINSDLIKANEENSKKVISILIHEKLHANRNILFHEAIGDKEELHHLNKTNKEDEVTFISKDGKVNQHTSNYLDRDVDPNQDVYKGSIDRSKNALSTKVPETNKKVSDNLKRNTYIDETIVTLITKIASKISLNKLLSKDTDIWEELKSISKRKDLVGTDKSIAPLAKIILKHKNLDLFKWTLDPLTYTADDPHYDYFSHYTKSDKDLVDEMMNYEQYQGKTEEMEI